MIDAPAKTTYISAADTAKLVRAALRDAFPAGRFSVRTSTTGTIRVGYVDGPPTRKVQDVVGRFAGRDFDGSIDLGFYIDHYVLDGKVVGTRTSGSSGSGGYVPAHDDAVPGATLVHLGSGFVFVDRDLSADAIARKKAIVRDRFGTDYAPFGSSDYVDETLGDLPFGALPTKAARLLGARP